MGLRTRGKEGLERELGKMRSRLEQEERAAEQADRLASTDVAALERLAADEVAGKVAGDEVAAQLEKISDGARRHRLNAGHHRRSLALLREEVAQIERQIAEQPFEAALERAQQFVPGMAKMEGLLAQKINGLTAAAAMVQKQRAELDRALAEARRCCPAWRAVDVEIPDAPAWTDEAAALSRLVGEAMKDAARAEQRKLRENSIVDVLAQGPRRPAASAATARQKQAERAAREEASRVAAAVRELAAHLDWGREDDERALATSKYGSIPRARHDEVLELVARRRAELEREWALRNPQAAKARAAAVPG